MANEWMRARATSFGAAAAAYERGRPSYPTEAVDWVLASGPRRVLDLGAGTGKLTRRLCERDLEVVAVEPLAGMRAQLARTAPCAEVLDGSAEALPLAHRSVDAVLAAQAWHWVDPARAVPEVARVLTRGGWLGLLWNIRDERADWVAQLGAIMHRHGEGDSDEPAPRIGAPFGPLERHDVAWTYRLSRAAVLDLVASRSYVITLPESVRAELLDEVRLLVDTHPALAGADELALPYVTRCFRARLDG